MFVTHASAKSLDEAVTCRFVRIQAAAKAT